MNERSQGTGAGAGRGPRRRLRPEDRRAELLATAMEVLKERNPEEVRVEDVTQAAGVAKGTFYVYFPSWDDLLMAIREHLLTTHATEVRRRFAAASPGDRWAVLEAECVHFVDFVIDLGELHRAIFHGAIADRPAGTPDRAVPLIAELLASAIAAGACRDVDVQVAAPLVFSVLHTTADEIARTGERQARLDPALELLRRWLRVAAGGAEGCTGQET